MQYVGIDIAKRAHVAGARLEDGTPHGKPFRFANDQQGFASLLRRLRELGAGPVYMSTEICATFRLKSVPPIT